ncbi:MAG: hypothetical protein GY928_20710 [Colwellia sp.]|nr:hypothetical protein [Colwellia sp.]
MSLEELTQEDYADVMGERIEEAKQAVELRQSLYDAIDYKLGERMYKENILDKVKDYVSDDARNMAIQAWEDDYIKFGEFIKIRRVNKCPKV